MSAELFAKLARLRREERAPQVSVPDRSGEKSRAARAEPGWSPPTPEKEEDKLRALPRWLTKRFAADGSSVEDWVRGAERSLGPPSDLVEQANERGSFAARGRSYAGEHAHGDWRLGEVLEASGEEFAWLARDTTLATLSTAGCVYLDIETTGLAGGAGTIPFLVALGSFENGAFRLWQAFLRDPAEEAAALAEVAARIRASTGLVSFFGKSFDRHRLEDKMRFYRIAPPFAEKPHLDLYHPLARLYRGAYRDGRLGTLETELCGVTRTDDLPGSFAPAAWFDFLAERPHRLEAVFRHNELDVLSLVTLAAHLACARRETRRDGRALVGSGRTRARALAELHAARREYEPALGWLAHALTRPGSQDGELWFRRAELLAKSRARADALEAFLRLAREHDDALGARAWSEVFRLARRQKSAEIEREARERGLPAIERTLTGRARTRARSPFEHAPAGAAPRTGG